MTTLNEEQTDILVFKTNLRFKKDLKKIASCIEGDPRIKRWNVDTLDSDNVLRIESIDMETSEVIQMVELAGYHCEELTS